MKLRLALAFVLIAIGLHYYLTNHFYELQMGVSAGDSICNVSESISCDATSASSFASLFGVPIAAWGGATNGILLVLIFGWMLRWTDDLGQLSRYTYYLAGFVALVSVVMGVISTLVLGSYCLFCIGTYLCSWVVFGLLHLNLDSDERSFLTHIKALAGAGKTYAGFLVAIPISALLFNAAAAKKYGAENIEKYIRASISDWRSAPQADFGVAPSLVKGASDEEAKFVISEFADFRCSHCKNAYPSLKAFVGTRKDVQLRFFNFPLDNTCNDVIGGGDGVSCLLAKSISCAEKVSGKGWNFHDAFFEEQAAIMNFSLKQTQERVTNLISQFAVNADEFKTCLESEETQNWIKSQAKAGEENGVKGTPAIYVNSKKLPRGQSLPVLERLYQMMRQ